MQNFSWQMPEYIHIEKSSDWYWTVGIISIALTITAIIFGNLLFALILALSTFILMIFSARKPRIIDIEIDHKKVRIDKTLYLFSALESFGIDEEHRHGPKLHLKSKKAIMPLITISAHPDHVPHLKTFLVQHLKEEKFEDSVAHALFERLGF